MRIHIVHADERPWGDYVSAVCGVEFLNTAPMDANFLEDGRVCPECFARHYAQRNREPSQHRRTFAIPEADHDVFLDRVEGAGRAMVARFTCRTVRCKGANIVHEQSLTHEGWTKLATDFLAAHPTANIPSIGFCD